MPELDTISRTPVFHANRRSWWSLAASSPARYGTAVLTVATVIAALNQLWIASVNPWILVTAPLNAAHAGNSIIGYSWLLDGGPIHKENLSPLFPLSLRIEVTPPSIRRARLGWNVRARAARRFIVAVVSALRAGSAGMLSCRPKSIWSLFVLGNPMPIWTGGQRFVLAIGGRAAGHVPRDAHALKLGGRQHPFRQ
jgi:hypothetical protein